MIGDILFLQERCFVIAAREIADFVTLHLNRVGSESVSLELCDRNDLAVPERRVEQRTVTVVSLRVDALVSSVFRLSRAKAPEAIRGGNAGSTGRWWRTPPARWRKGIPFPCGGGDGFGLMPWREKRKREGFW